MAEAADLPSSSDVDLDPKSELKVVGSKQRLAKQAEVEVVEELAECSRMSTKQAASSETVAEAQTTADNGEDQSPNSDESDRTVVDTGQSVCCLISEQLSRLFNDTGISESAYCTLAVSYYHRTCGARSCGDDGVARFLCKIPLLTTRREYNDASWLNTYPLHLAVLKEQGNRHSRRQTRSIFVT